MRSCIAPHWTWCEIVHKGCVKLPVPCLDANLSYSHCDFFKELMQHYVPCGSDQVDSSGTNDQELLTLRQKMREMIAENEEMAQRCHELDNQVCWNSLKILRVSFIPYPNQHELDPCV